MNTSKKSLVFSRLAAILLIICFFMPWVTVSCNGDGVTGTGLEFVIRIFDQVRGVTRCEDFTATGVGLATGIQNKGQQLNALYFIMPIVALVTFGASFLTLGIARKVYFASAIGGLISMVYVYFQNGIAYFKIGWWLSLVALFTILLAGYLTRGDEVKEGDDIQEILESNKQKASFRP